MNTFDRIACWFCRRRIAKHSRRVELHMELADAYADRAQYWSERELHYTVRHMLAGKPNAADTSDVPFLPNVEQRARKAGA